MSEIKHYEPDVCSNKSCLGYGDSVPSDHGRCFICHHPLVHFSQIPYDDLNSFVRRVLEHHYMMYGERELRGDMIQNSAL